MLDDFPQLFNGISSQDCSLAIPPLPRSAAGFLATTAGLWRSDRLVPRLEWIRPLTFQPPTVGSEQSRPWAICSSLEGMILPRCSPHNSWCPPLSWVDDVQLTEYLMRHHSPYHKLRWEFDVWSCGHTGCVGSPNAAILPIWWVI